MSVTVLIDMSMQIINGEIEDLGQVRFPVRFEDFDRSMELEIAHFDWQNESQSSKQRLSWKLDLIKLNWVFSIYHLV